MVLLMAACEDASCERELRTSVSYTGVRTGVVYTRLFVPGEGFSGGGQGPSHNDAGIAVGGGTSDLCWRNAATADEPGGVLEGWVDVDGDDATRCSCEVRPGVVCGLADRAVCGPEPGDPQVRQKYTLHADGTTVVELKFGDL